MNRFKKMFSLFSICFVALGAGLSLTACGGCDHYWSVVSDTATCTSNGTKTYRCNKCNQTKTESSYSLGHDWRETSNTATCLNSGTKTSTCNRCHQTKTESSPALGHNWNPNADNCYKCGEYKYPIRITNSIPVTVGWKLVTGSGYYSKVQITKLEFYTYNSKVQFYGSAKKTYDYKGDNGTTACNFKIKLYCVTDDTVLGIGKVYDSGIAVGQTYTFDSTSGVYRYNLSTSKQYTATIIDAD